jgi:serine/threonine protein kinase
MIGQIIWVVEKFGGGGMGVVNRAEDLKLRREVALNFLPDELAQNPTVVERFAAVPQR